jgi:hypothetical protein
VPKTRFRLQTRVVREESNGASGPRVRTDVDRSDRLDALAGGVRRGDIGFFGERLRLWRRDAGFVLWHGLRLLRLRLALLAFTLGIQDITGQAEPPLISIRDTFYPPPASKNRGRLHPRGFAHENHVAAQRARCRTNSAAGRILVICRKIEYVHPTLCGGRDCPGLRAALRSGTAAT